MAVLQVRDIDDRLYASLKNRAKNEKRSISQEVIHIIQAYLSNPKHFSFNPTEEFLKLSGSWENSKTADEIIEYLTKNRKKLIFRNQFQ